MARNKRRKKDRAPAQPGTPNVPSRRSTFRDRTIIAAIITAVAAIVAALIGYIAVPENRAAVTGAAFPVPFRLPPPPKLAMKAPATAVNSGLSIKPDTTPAIVTRMPAAREASSSPSRIEPKRAVNSPDTLEALTNAQPLAFSASSPAQVAQTVAPNNPVATPVRATPGELRTAPSALWLPRLSAAAHAQLTLEMQPHRALLEKVCARGVDIDAFQRYALTLHMAAYETARDGGSALPGAVHAYYKALHAMVHGDRELAAFRLRLETACSTGHRGGVPLIIGRWDDAFEALKSVASDDAIR